MITGGSYWIPAPLISSGRYSKRIAPASRSKEEYFVTKGEEEEERTAAADI